jgi:hypothetical protein
MYEDPLSQASGLAVTLDMLYLHDLVYSTKEYFSTSYWGFACSGCNNRNYCLCKISASTNNVTGHQYSGRRQSLSYQMRPVILRTLE